MSPEHAASDDAAGHLLNDPDGSLAAARQVLAGGDASAQQRAEALCALGCAAYYANRVGEAIRLLGEAETLATAPALRAEVLLALAPALSKDGRSEEALALLGDSALAAPDDIAGQAQNQRAIILTDAGRLPEAAAAAEAALVLLRRAGSAERVARTLVNLGVIESFRGDQVAAEEWYRAALEAATAAGLGVVVAGIEGNLGYVAFRRGNFAAALDWFERSRASLAAFDDVDLLVANVELDHARTLLDVGLAVDAADAAQRAVASAASGGNAPLELQGRLVLAEALIRSADRRAATRELDTAQTIAERSGHEAASSMVRHLRAELLADAGELGAADVVADLPKYIEAGWGREAYTRALRVAVRLGFDEPELVLEVLDAADQHCADVDIEPVARALAGLLRAAISRDRTLLAQALRAALDSLREQYRVVGELETLGTSVWYLRPIAEVAIDGLRRLGAPATEVLEAVEACRHVAAGLQPRELDGWGSPERRADAAGCAASPGPGASTGGVSQASSGERADEIYLTHVASRGRLIGLFVTADEVGVFDAEAVDVVATAMQTQRRMLQRLGDARRGDDAASLRRLDEVNATLDDALFGGLPSAIRRRLSGDSPQAVGFTPAAQISHIAWAALPTLRSPQLVIAATRRAWLASDEPIQVGDWAALGGPGLDADRSELEAIAAAWGRPDAVVANATVSQAAAAFERADLVHVAAHGRFRSDNPVFSSLQFADGDLTVLGLSELRRTPAVVVLASCEAGAAGGRHGIDDDVVLGTALQLTRLGSRAVVASTVAISDRAAASYSNELHRSLAAGESPAAAAAAARRRLLATGQPDVLAAAWSFQLLGDRGAYLPLQLDASLPVD